MVDLDYLKRTSLQKFFYRLWEAVKCLPLLLWSAIKAIPRLFVGVWRKVIGVFQTIGGAIAHGDWKTRVSLVVMGFGQFARKQILRGLLYLIFQASFVLFMTFFGWKFLAKLSSLGEVAMVEEWDEAQGIFTYKFYDNSLLILLYSLITIFVIVAFVYTWYMNVKGNLSDQTCVEAKQKLPTVRDELAAYANEQYHKSLLAIPMGGLLVFTVLPLIFMIFIAFTNYDRAHMPPKNLFSWVGVQNFVTLFGGGLSVDSKVFAFTFEMVLLWTIVWAFFATFTNYILGMIVAIAINKKSIKFKKLWRTVLVMTIAIPQFVSLMLMSQLLSDQGLFNKLMLSWGWISKPIPFLTNGLTAKFTIILVNIWIGIPFTMLICTGILMNIPQDLYESAKIDGSGAVRTYFKITLPYMLHVTTPYLITQFIGNINNFNVIYLLTGGEPLSLNFQFAGETDLLITWLYKLTVNQSQYALASVIGIVTFIIVAVFSLVLYNKSSAIKNEEVFM